MQIGESRSQRRRRQAAKNRRLQGAAVGLSGRGLQLCAGYVITKNQRTRGTCKVMRGNCLVAFSDNFGLWDCGQLSGPHC